MIEKYFPSERWEDAYRLTTAPIRRVARYAGIDFNAVLNLPYSYFMLLNREAWIDSYMQTEQGRELLKTLWRLQQTEADVNALHDYQQKRGA